MIARVWIGYDPKEHDAYRVAEHSLRKHASCPVEVIPLDLDKLRKWQLLWRRFEVREGITWDILSKAPMSSTFALTRFFVPILAHSGWGLFLDCDVIVQSDIAKLFALADDRYAVMCVKHPELDSSSVKMVGALQTSYPKKNWSSVVLYNADHTANRRLTLGVLNNTPGRDLHAFRWLHDEEIGELPDSWNWLCGVREKPDRVDIAHLTLGSCWLKGWKGGPYDDMWLEAARDAGVR